MSHSLGSFAYLSKNVFGFFEETRTYETISKLQTLVVFSYYRDNQSLRKYHPLCIPLIAILYELWPSNLRVNILLFSVVLFFQKLTWFKKKLCSTLFLSVEMCRYFTPCLFENWREKVAGRQCWGENRHWKWFFKKSANLPWLSRYRSESWEQQNQPAVGRTKSKLTFN